MTNPINRRGAIASLAGGGLLLSGCDRIGESRIFAEAVGAGRALTMNSQRLLIGRDKLAAEFSSADISPRFRANGSTNPDDPAYRAMATSGFSQWRLQIGGLVQRPLALSLADLKAMPRRTQITRHDCVEGWSAIGQWTGTPLAAVLARAGLLPAARYVVLYCADRLDGDAYYESIDLIDAFHPQTILADQMNGQALPVAHGAPLRLRVERQLGYKHAKYVMRIDLVSDLATIGAGKGGYWEDRRDYDWYAGI
jgi:DMSO/TMAO reductase YedYZ molybdopterin-dependent catalytic subunit